jgi:hypothetical protein
MRCGAVSGNESKTQDTVLVVLGNKKSQSGTWRRVFGVVVSALACVVARGGASMLMLMLMLAFLLALFVKAAVVVVVSVPVLFLRRAEAHKERARRGDDE